MVWFGWIFFQNRTANTLLSSYLHIKSKLFIYIFFVFLVWFSFSFSSFFFFTGKFVWAHGASPFITSSTKLLLFNFRFQCANRAKPKHDAFLAAVIFKLRIIQPLLQLPRASISHSSLMYVNNFHLTPFFSPTFHHNLLLLLIVIILASSICKNGESNTFTFFRNSPPP